MNDMTEIEKKIKEHESFRDNQAIWLQNVEERVCDCSVQDGDFFEPNPEMHDKECEYRKIAS